MSEQTRQYRPCLRWKQGEYQALMRLDETIKGQIMPLIEVDAIGWDFEAKREKNTIDDHLMPLPKRVEGKWGDGTCLIDCRYVLQHRLKDNLHPIPYIHNELRTLGCHAVPVLNLDADGDTVTAVSEVVKEDQYGACVRIPFELAASGLGGALPDLIGSIGIEPSQVDVVIDLGVPSFQPIEDFLGLVEGTYCSVPSLNDWRSLTLLGSSMIPTMAQVSIGVSVLERSEWVLYKSLVNRLRKTGTRLPDFGDYGTRHPKLSNIDMRLMKPAASIRYTCDDAWYIAKGTNVRDNKFAQYRAMCTSLLESDYYQGREYSHGDEFIYKCAKEGGSTGNLTSWVEVGASHHLTRVARDLSSLA